MNDPVMMKDAMRGSVQEGVKFILTGFINTFLGLSVIFGLKYWFGVDDVWANVSGYAVGIVASFYINANWTFSYKGSMYIAAVRFILVFAISYCVNLGILYYCLSLGSINSYLCHLISMIGYSIVFFLASKFFAFRSVPELP